MAGIQPAVRWVASSGRRIAITVVGFGLVLVGVVGTVVPILPGPILLIAGLAVLSTEYVWARRALAHARSKAARIQARIRARRGPAAP